MSRRDSWTDISYLLLIGGIACIALLVLVTPVVIVLLTSLTDSQTMSFPPKGISLRWYEALFDSQQSSMIHAAAFNSVTVAAISALAAVLLGASAAIGLQSQRNSAVAKGLQGFFLSPLVLPGISFGLAALMFFTLVGFNPSMSLMVIGHLVMVVPFVLRTTSSSLMQMDYSLLESSSILGASRWYGFRRVMLPLITPGIAAGAFMALMASMDNVPVSLFLADADTDMLPIRMWGMMESTLDVRVAAVSGVLILSVLLMMLLMERAVGLTKRLQA